MGTLPIVSVMAVQALRMVSSVTTTNVSKVVPKTVVVNCASSALPLLPVLGNVVLVMTRLNVQMISSAVLFKTNVFHTATLIVSVMAVPALKMVSSATTMSVLQVVQRTVMVHCASSALLLLRKKAMKNKKTKRNKKKRLTLLKNVVHAIQLLIVCLDISAALIKTSAFRVMLRTVSVMAAQALKVALSLIIMNVLKAVLRTVVANCVSSVLLRLLKRTHTNQTKNKKLSFWDMFPNVLLIVLAGQLIARSSSLTPIWTRIWWRMPLSHSGPISSAASTRTLK